ncbi:MAG: hypothetical protein ACREE2_03825 [Stellaceae bacterium]
MSRLGEALDHLERAVARLEAALAARAGVGAASTGASENRAAPVAGENARLRREAGEIAVRVDQSLARINQALGEGG